jgi:sugar/nucleoside kinase (ribokinase family)
MSRILVVGSAHLDIIASTSGNGEAYLDKIGEVSIGIGGTAFNIASNLKNKEANVEICTALNKSLFSGGVILDVLKTSGFKQEFIINDSHLKDSCFVGHLIKGELTSAVSCIEIENAKLFAEGVVGFIENKDFDCIVVDCNLPDHALKDILECAKNQKPKPEVVVAGTSQPKILRLANLKNDTTGAYYTTGACLCLNRAEFDALKGALDPVSDEKSLVSHLGLKKMLVTEGPKGAKLFDETTDGAVTIHPPTLRTVNSTIGAGDAACAGFVIAHLDNENISKYNENISRLVRELVKENLETGGANLYPSKLAPEALQSEWRRRHQKNRFYRLMKWFGAFAAVLFTFVEITNFFGFNLADLLDF